MTPPPHVQYGGRPDASAKAAGRAGYTEDLAPADALVGVVVRARSAPARVAELDVAAAAPPPPGFAACSPPPMSRR